jgi:hypothetical protein
VNQPLKRQGTPVDCAHASVYFVSDRTAYMTGHVDGGISAGAPMNLHALLMETRAEYLKTHEGEQARPRRADMHFNGQFQNAYVTHDIDKAITLVEDHFGLTEWIRVEPDTIVHTPSGDHRAVVRVALGWSGTTQIELIEPVSGFVGHYRDYLPADKNDPTPRFHHVAVRRDDQAAMRDEIARLGLPLAFEGEVPGLVFIYLDARESLGHYFEYIWADESGWKMQGWPEGRSTI